MARAFPESSPNAYGRRPDPGEWQALRGELVALLDQVEGQVARTVRQEPVYQGLAERMRDLRHQVTEVEPDTRQREALRSVRRAVDRFTDRDEHLETASGLKSAINELRARNLDPRMAEPAYASPSPGAHSYGADLLMPRFDQMAEAVGGITGRLERLEGELKTQARNSGNVKDIADQVGQLAHVIELLAGAVGETGQVKRLESQIAGLARIVGQGPKVDLSSLTQRLDDVSATMGHLADMQVQVAGRTALPQPPDPALSAGMLAIEQSLRNVYDRIDTLERSMALAPAELEKLTAGMAEVTAAVAAVSHEPRTLIELVEGLNDRIGELEGRDAAVNGLKADMLSLRDAVVDSTEPRFTAIELQLETLNDRLAQRSIDPGLSQIEAQVRQLVARMDQTGEQLATLARLQEETAERPDLAQFEAIAAEIGRRSDAATSATAESIRRLEAKVAELVSRDAREDADDAAAEMQAGIMEVNDRLARLEASIATRAREDDLRRADEARQAARNGAALPAGSIFASPAPAAPLRSLSETISDVETGLHGAPEAMLPRQSVLPDTMPASPSAERPLTDRAFADPSPVLAALDARNGARMRHPGLSDFDPEARPRPVAAHPKERALAVDPSSIELPPAPRSSLADESDFFADTTSEPATVAPSIASASTTSTFIAAARRAAQRQGGATAQVSAGSLIGRAFARFQAEPQPEPAKPLTAAKPSLRRVEPKAPQVDPAPAVATGTVSAAEAAFVADTQSETASSSEQSFLARHHRPILLAAAVVALAFLTLNLVNQRLRPPADAPVPTAAAPATTIPGASPAATPAAALPTALPARPLTPAATPIGPNGPNGPRVITLADTITTGSVDPASAKGFTPNPAPPVLPSAFVPPAQTPAVAAIAALPQAAEAPGSAPAEAQSFLAAVDAAIKAPGAIDAALQFDLPPEQVGPQLLRNSAAAGDARAQFEVAAILTEGRVLPEDNAAAATWYTRSAVQGFAPAQYRLGSLYEYGRGVEKDLEQARLWYQRAAEAGNRMSMHNLAALYAGGELGKQDFASAAQWFEQAAARGLTDSQFNLGMLYARGLGVKQDFETSYRWFSLAAIHGDADAAKARDDIARSLDAEAVARVSADLRTWEPIVLEFAANFAPIGTWDRNFDPGLPVTKKDIVASVQSALGRLGFEAGTPDGVAGPRTAEAIRSFERATGMTESGAINPRLLAVLGSQPV